MLNKGSRFKKCYHSYFYLMHSYKLSTSKIMLLGLVFAILANIPFYTWVFGEYWSWATGFPLSWIGTGLNYMAIFFHEIGHTVFMWFYGYPTLPTFDFEHGGGMSWALSGQKIPIVITIWFIMGYGFWILKGHKKLQLGIVLLCILNITLVFNQHHTALLDFMGPAFESLVASFFLYRALFNLAPRGDLERFLNSFFGFAMIFQVFVNAYGLLKSEAYRLAYYQQKGSHGFGDFDKIADRISYLSFDAIVSIWIILNTICLILPLILYTKSCIQNRI